MCFHYLELNNFRNIAFASIALGPRFNLVLGRNAQGKSNFLESLFAVSDLRSFRGAAFADMVQHGEEKTTLSAKADIGALDYDVGLELSKGRLHLSVNGKTVRRRRDYLGSIPSVAFTPDDVSLSKGDPQARRRFLDRALFLLDPSHWERVAEYKQIIRRRNLMLKERKTGDPLFSVYTEQASRLGAEISYSRQHLSQKLNERIEPSSQAVSGDLDSVTLDYKSHLEKDGCFVVNDGGERLHLLMDKQLAHDTSRGWTSVGPQSEDLDVLLDGQLASRVASQGQHRTIALLLKLSEIDVVHGEKGVFPLLLIDDLSSELDIDRQRRLFDYLNGTGGQVVLTATESRMLELLPDADIRQFTVENGVISAEGNQE